MQATSALAKNHTCISDKGGMRVRACPRFGIIFLEINMQRDVNRYWPDLLAARLRKKGSLGTAETAYTNLTALGTATDTLGVSDCAMTAGPDQGASRRKKRSSGGSIGHDSTARGPTGDVCPGHRQDGRYRR